MSAANPAGTHSNPLSPSRLNAFHFSFAAMGCPCALHVETESETQARRALAIAEDELRRLDRKYSHYRDDSLIAEWAAHAGSSSPFRVDDETAALLDFAAALHEQSAGLFDITAGTLTRLWDLRGGVLPGIDRVDEALSRVGWHRLSWQSPLLSLPIAGMRVDLGGIVKEYAADRVAQLCREAGFRHGMVDLGGDLAVIGAHRDGSAWRVGIKSPESPDHAAAHIDVSTGGLATSGDYERCLVIDGRRYSHIVDPRNGQPIDSFASVSVSAPSCLIAGAAATVAMLLGTIDGAAYLRDIGLPHLCLQREMPTNL
jgi:FAD:protein FMN transferase